MQKNLKKVLSFVLAMVMALGIVTPAVPVFATETASSSDLPGEMEGLSIAYPYNTEVVQLTGTPTSRFDALTFESARGEVESAQMILTPNFNVTSFELTMNSLKNEKGNIIPGWAFDVYTQHYVSIEGAGNGANYSSQYNMYSPKTGESVANGRYPDALIPQTEAITAGENTITAGQNQGIWVNLNVQSAAPGTYTGYATLTVNGTAMQISVSVRIYDVVVPEEVHQKTGMLIWWDQLQAGEGYIDRALADTYFDYIVSKRLSPMDAWNYTRYDDALAEYAASYLAVAPEISAYCLPHTRNADGTVNEEALRTTLTTLINKNLELAASGSNTDLFKKAYFYIYDEPYGDSEYAIANQITATLESVKNELAPMLAAYPSIQESFLNLKHIVTAPNPADKTYRRLGSWPNYSFANDDHGNTPLTGDSYIYAPQYQWLNTESQRALYENEEELWWYGCCHPVQPYPTYHINGSLISARAVSWMMQDYGIDGYVYSSVNYWGNYEGDSIVQMDYWNKYTSGTPGDMLLVYPGSSYGVYGPIGTIRLENIREGNEDYEYLWMLRNVYGISDISAYTKGLYEGVIVTGTYDGHTVDPDGDGNTDANAIHHANRIALLAKLEQLNVAANGATQIAPGQEGFVRGESFNSAVSTTINLDNNQEVAAIQFDYKITSGNTMKMALLPNWSSYYGYFSFGANGLDADGVYCQTLNDGYIRAVLVLDELTIMHEDPSNVITMLYMNGTSDAVGYMDNIQVLYEVPEIPEVPEVPEVPEEPVGVTYEIAAGLEIDVTDGTYDYISFEYQITNDGEMSICALSPDWGKYYGYYSFNASGKVWEDAGIYAQTLSDGFVRIILKISELERTNSAYNLNNAPETIGLLLVGSNTATGTIRNVKLECGHIYESVVTEPTTDAQGYTTHTCMVCGHSYVDSYVDPIQPEEPVSYDISTGLEIDVTDGAYDYISFEYQITNDGEMSICALSPDWGKYYGYYSFNANGKVWEDAGIYAQTLSDGFVRIILKISELERTNSAYNLNNAPETVGLLYVGGSNTATGTIRNVKLECGHIYESVVTEPTTEAQGYTTHTCGVCGHSYVDSYVDPIQPEEPVSYDISTGLEIDVTDGTYDYISFEYQITNEGVLYIGALSPDWGKYYGYYSFNANGKVWEDNGVYCETLGDGFYRVTLKVAELERTNNAYNLINAPETVGLLYVGGSNTATGTIRNVQLSDTCAHIYESVVTPPTTTQQGYTTHTCTVCGDSYVDNYVEPVSVSYEIAGDTQIDVEDGAYSFISFEYQITNEGVLYIGALSPDWGKYYGYYEFNANGKVWEDKGIYCTDLSDDYYRITLNVSQLERTNNVANLDNAPETIGLLYISGSNSATGTIRNVRVYNQNDCSHNYNAVVTEPSFVANGYTTYTCSSCGDSYTADETAAYTASVKEWNIALSDDISATFYVNVDSRIENPTAQIAVGKNVSSADFIKQDDGTYAVTVKVAAAQMTDDISIQVVVGDLVSDTMTYSIRQYAEKILTGEYNAKTKNLVKAMLNYGAMAQTYFGYNTGDLANKDYVNTDAVEIPAVDTSNMVSGSVDGIRFYGASLVFESKVAVRFYFTVTGDINSYTFSTGSDPVLKNGMYYIEVANINPQDYANIIELAVNDTLVVRYSPLTYISRKANADNALADLVKAMYQYYEASVAFLTEDDDEPEVPQDVFAGGDFTSGDTLTVNLDNAQAVTHMTFDYQITDGESFSLALLPGSWSNYYGYFTFESAGAKYEYTGIFTEQLDNGYIRVYVDFAKLTQFTGTPDSTVIDTLYMRNVTANGTITNICINGAAEVAPRGQAIVAGQSLSVMTEAGNYSQVILDMIVPAEGGENEIGIALIDTNWNYYGYFYLEKTGLENPYAGVSAEQLSDGYWRITINIDEIDSSRTHGDVGDIERVYINNHTTGGYIDNVQFIKNDAPRGQEIVAGQNLSVMADQAANYSQVILDMIVPAEGGENEIGIALVDTNWNYYGYFYLEKTGLENPYAGVSAEQLSDGYWRITINIDEIDGSRTHGDVGDIERVYIHNHTTGGYIDNVQFVVREEPEYVDYAVAANGVKRAGSPTWEDTAEGLQVTFAAAGNRFEIKCGDQTVAANGTLQFKIKTDLTSIKLGGCNYSGLRKTTVTVDLTASADGYTVTDLGDGWVLVEVPMSVIGVADYLAEFAIRFYDTNAAGTFYLKDMNFVA